MTKISNFSAMLLAAMMTATGALRAQDSSAGTGASNRTGSAVGPSEGATTNSGASNQGRGISADSTNAPNLGQPPLNDDQLRSVPDRDFGSPFAQPTPAPNFGTGGPAAPGRDATQGNINDPNRELDRINERLDRPGFDADRRDLEQRRRELERQGTTAP